MPGVFGDEPGRDHRLPLAGKRAWSAARALVAWTTSSSATFAGTYVAGATLSPERETAPGSRPPAPRRPRRSRHASKSSSRQRSRVTWTRGRWIGEQRRGPPSAMQPAPRRLSCPACHPRLPGRDLRLGILRRRNELVRIEFLQVCDRTASAEGDLADECRSRSG